MQTLILQEIPTPDHGALRLILRNPQPAYAEKVQRGGADYKTRVWGAVLFVSCTKWLKELMKSENKTNKTTRQQDTRNVHARACIGGCCLVVLFVLNYYSVIKNNRLAQDTNKTGSGGAVLFSDFQLNIRGLGL